MSGYLGKLPRKTAVRGLITKAIESAVLSVEVYNKPTVQFRTAAYTSLMIIAWTAAFHAYFENRSENYYHKKKNGRFDRIDGDKKAWELLECVKNYEGETIDVDIASNLRLFVKLRNKIEHRQMATLDAHVAAEAQALLLNLKGFLANEFEIELLGDMGLYIPISVFSKTRMIPQSVEEQSVLNFIDKYRNSLAPEVWQDTKYAFRAFLIPKIGNHENSTDVTIEFLKLDSLSDAQKVKATRMASLIRDRQVPFKEDLLKPAGVVERVRETHANFHMTNFVNAWKTTGVRPLNTAENPAETDTKYCHYDPVDRDYRYEPEFCDLICSLIKKGENF